MLFSWQILTLFSHFVFNLNQHLCLAQDNPDLFIIIVDMVQSWIVKGVSMVLGGFIPKKENKVRNN